MTDLVPSVSWADVADQARVLGAEDFADQLDATETRRWRGRSTAWRTPRPRTCAEPPDLSLRQLSRDQMEALVSRGAPRALRRLEARKEQERIEVGVSSTTRASTGRCWRNSARAATVTRS